METVDTIEHNALVKGIDLKDNTVRVRILREGECGSCPAARLCGVADGKGDEMTLSDPRPQRFSVGERVMVVGRESLHRKAIMVATVIPCLILIISMTCVFVATGNQPASVITGLALTALFYLCLYLMRNRITHEFSFTVKKTK